MVPSQVLAVSIELKTEFQHILRCYGGQHLAKASVYVGWIIAEQVVGETGQIETIGFATLAGLLLNVMEDLLVRLRQMPVFLPYQEIVVRALLEWSVEMHVIPITLLPFPMLTGI